MINSHIRGVEFSERSSRCLPARCMLFVLLDVWLELLRYGCVQGVQNAPFDRL